MVDRSGYAMIMAADSEIGRVYAGSGRYNNAGFCELSFSNGIGGKSSAQDCAADCSGRHIPGYFVQTGPHTIEEIGMVGRDLGLTQNPALSDQHSICVSPPTSRPIIICPHNARNGKLEAGMPINYTLSVRFH